MRQVTFHNTMLDIIDRDGQLWLRGPQVAGALGYSGAWHLTALFNRYSEEFTPDMTQVLRLPTGRGLQDVRVFSARGAHLLALFARTHRASEFRKWVLDLIGEKVAERHDPAPAATTPQVLARGDDVPFIQIEWTLSYRQFLAFAEIVRLTPPPAGVLPSRGVARLSQNR